MAARLRPDAILLLATGHWTAGVLRGAVATGLFSHIARGSATVAQLAAAVAGDAAGIRVTLNALTALGLLRKEGEAYRLRPLAETYLVEESPSYLGDLVTAGCASPYHFRVFEHYERVIAQGRALDLDVWVDDKEYAASLATGLFSINRPIAEKVCDELGWKGEHDEARSLLDLGRSAGAFGLTALLRLPRARLTLLDHPHLTAVARRFAEQLGVAGRLEERPGDCRREPLGGPYDAVFISQLLHTFSEAEQQRLLGACRGALRAGGHLVVVEFLPDEGRRGNMGALLFEAMVYGFTGRTFHTPLSLRRLLEANGFLVHHLKTEGPGGYAIAQA